MAVIKGLSLSVWTKDSRIALVLSVLELEMSVSHCSSFHLPLLLVKQKACSLSWRKTSVSSLEEKTSKSGKKFCESCAPYTSITFNYWDLLFLKFCGNHTESPFLIKQLLSSLSLWSLECPPWFILFVRLFHPGPQICLKNWVVRNASHALCKWLSDSRWHSLCI